MFECDQQGAQLVGCKPFGMATSLVGKCLGYLGPRLEPLACMV
jgi:hypothetical protein